MKIDTLRMAPFNTTLMGVLRGVLDYFGSDVSDAWLYGSTGHAFLMNIHPELCPSGPYCWNRRPFYPLVTNLGVEMTDLGFFWSGSGPGERQAVEGALRRCLDEGTPCSLLNMENQLITGYDDTGFLTAQPWAPHADFPPAHLTFGTWDEFGGECHVNFFRFDRLQPAAPAKAAADALRYAVDLYRNPAIHTSEPYGVGAAAYGQWIAAVEAGHGAGHGNWWNGTVWSECRARARDYFVEIGERWPALSGAAGDLADRYGAIHKAMHRASDRDLPPEAKVESLRGAAAAEAACIPRLEELAASLA